MNILSGKRILRLLLLTALVLLIPFVAMQFTHEVTWTIGDFVVAALLLFGAGIAFEMIVARVKNSGLKIAACLILFLAVALVWAELAVGIF